MSKKAATLKHLDSAIAALKQFTADVAKAASEAIKSLTAADVGALTEIKIGTVTTGAAGSKASASTTTTGTVSTLNLTIPKGDKGDTGAVGATGPQGPTGATGAQGPKGDTGATGATGAKGATGTTGTRGSRWNTGTAITGTSTTATVFSNSGITDALVNDMYLNTSTGAVYRCTVAGAAAAAKWVYVGSIKGATGAAGAKGATGATGAQGAKGDKGDKGDTGAQGVAGAKGATGAKGDKGDLGVQYSTCSTAAATVAKTAALTGFVLATGAAVMIRFAVTNTAANPTLNVNNTGAKAIRYRNAAISAGYLAANRTYMFVYDGTYWQLVGDLDTNTHTVTGIKGNAEKTYRTGNVNLTPANIGAAASNHTHVSTGTVSVPTTGWSSDSTAIFPKYYDLSISGILATDRVDLIVAISSLDTALKCGLCGITEASAGKVRIRSRTVPTAAINLQYWVMKK